jgi:hypothetical protein
MVPPPPQQTQTRPVIKPAIKYPKPNPPPILKSTPTPPPAVREMKPPVNIDDLLKSVNPPQEKKVVTTPTAKKGGSTGKNSVTIKL